MGGLSVRRRRFLELAAASSALVAGCSEGPSEPSATGTPTETKTRTERPSRTPTDTPRPQTDTPRQHPDRIFVGPDGSAGDPGTREAPLASVQAALERVEPGQTVFVLPGRYHEHVRSVRAGEPDAPITIAGTAEAELHGASPDRSHTLRINHDHIHLRGITLTSLHDPSEPNRLASYIENEPIRIHPPADTDEYLSGIVIKPSGLGYSRQQLIGLDRTTHAEIGEFRVIGRAGARYYLTGDEGHNAEIVYVGTSPANRGTSFYPWEEYDRTSHVHIHHIDNSAGHAHSEIVNAKLGTHDITVEYCTDGGGSKNNESYPTAAVRLQSYDATVRWCDLRNGEGWGVYVGSTFARDAQDREAGAGLTESERRGGTDNAIYGNRVTGFGAEAFAFPLSDQGQTPSAQRRLCGNQYDGPTHGQPGADCPDSVPTGDGIGHIGGDSPWS